jgi:hypothetical protein
MLNYFSNGDYMTNATVKTQEVTDISTTSETESTAFTAPVQLSIADLQLLSRVVDLASRRGAFQASELAQVGGVFNKLSEFLKYVEDAQKAEESKTAETVTM